MRINNAPLLSLLLLLGVTDAKAAPVTVGDLEHLTAQNVLLAAQLQGEQLQRQLRDSRNDGQTSSHVPVLPGALATSTPPVPRVTAGKVLEISGTSQRLSARVALADGSVLTVSPGQAFPGTGLTVKSLSATGVTLSDGRVVGVH